MLPLPVTKQTQQPPSLSDSMHDDSGTSNTSTDAATHITHSQAHNPHKYT